jgi:amidase
VSAVAASGGAGSAGLREVCFRSAREQRALLVAGEITARELLDAHLQRIHAVNPAVNAIVTLAQERAYELADRADRALAAGAAPGPLHGLPVVHKDLTETRGIRTTYGSPVFADFVPSFDSLVVERLVAAGAVSIGKSNVPEWGTGSQTYNPVFGATRNPYDLGRTCGGSTGGGAVALATGMAALADGSDMGGSLRNPASFCNVVGLRPSVGRVPSWPARAAFFTLVTAGPMARTVADVALMLSVLAEPHPSSPFAAAVDAARFAAPLERDFAGVRVAWSETLGGLPVEGEVRAALAGLPGVLGDIGCVVAAADPDLRAAEEAFVTLRVWYYALALGELARAVPEQLSDVNREEIERGRALSGEDVGRAHIALTDVWERMRSFMASHEFLVTITSQVAPFDVDEPFPQRIAGVPMTTYRDWMRSCTWISATGLPAISVPAGFTETGLPVGAQIVGRPGDDLGVLALAQAIEAATAAGRRRPPGALGGAA